MDLQALTRCSALILSASDGDITPYLADESGTRGEAQYNRNPAAFRIRGDEGRDHLGAADNDSVLTKSEPFPSERVVRNGVSGSIQGIGHVDLVKTEIRGSGLVNDLAWERWIHYPSCFLCRRQQGRFRD